MLQRCPPPQPKQNDFPIKSFNTFKTFSDVGKKNIGNNVDSSVDKLIIEGYMKAADIICKDYLKEIKKALGLKNSIEKMED